MKPLCFTFTCLYVSYLTADDDNLASKVLCYNRANRAVAVLCNHQRAAPKNFSEQMGRMTEKVHSTVLTKKRS